MSDKNFMGNSLDALESSPKFEKFTGVRLLISDTESIFVGNETGRVMEVPDMPWGTKEIAENILRLLGSYQYQPFKAEGLITDPALELGDAVTVGGVYGAVYNQDFSYDGFYRGEISSPHDEAINHEIPYKTKSEREYTRYKADVKSALKVQSGLIEAKVEATGGDTQSFGWKLEKDHHSWYANGVEIIRFSEDEAYFHGTVRAGKIIAGGANGYFSGSGLAAASVSGSKIGQNTITGGQYGNLSLNGITTTNVNSGINTSLGYANFSNSVFNGIDRAADIDTSIMRVHGTFYFSDDVNANFVKWRTTTIGGKTITYLGK